MPFGRYQKSNAATLQMTFSLILYWPLDCVLPSARELLRSPEHQHLELY